MVVGLVAEWRDAGGIPPAEQPAKAAVQPRMREEAPKRSSAYAQIKAPARGVDSTAAKPVIISTVAPWIEIKRRPQYVQASSAERNAIRDLYWRSCVEERIPPAHRISAYWQFVRDTTPVSQAQQAGAPSPVNAETMGRWCNS
jgi:hypothetical protein